MDSSKEQTCLMKTHFLKPCVTTIYGSVAELPRNRFSVSSSEFQTSFSKISFTGFWSPRCYFSSWALKMEALHEPTWRKAGIFEAIKASSFKIRKNRDLIIALVEKWCPETKSFVFPWGEATITLEDVIVMLGFSVLGAPVFRPVDSLEMRESVKKLEEVRQERINRCNNVSQVGWFSSFENSELEHEAFLALWLSRFVFPEKSRYFCVSRNVFPVAVRLARGERIAFAPVILASVYRDLSRIQDFARDDSSSELKVNSLFKLVQVWAWERFKNVRPEAIKLVKGEPRIARWNRVFQTPGRLSFDDFKWRPYVKPLENWNSPRFYVEEGTWMSVDDDLDDEFVAFARCLRVCKLVGIGFVEDYYPHRVAMQFGLSQDLPGLVTDRSDFTEEEAWEDYDKSLDGLKFYMPSRFATTSVTARYQDWWLKSVSEFLSSPKLEDVTPKLIPANLKRFRKRRIVKNVKWEMKKCKFGDCGESVPGTSEDLRNKRAREEDDNISIAEMIKTRGDGKRRVKVVESDDSESCEKLDSITKEQIGEEDDEIASKMQICDDNITILEAGSKAEKSSADHQPQGSIGGIGETVERNAEKKAMIDECTKGREEGLVRENEEKKTMVSAADTFDGSESNAEKKAMVDEHNKGEEDGLVLENAEKKSKVDDDNTKEDGEKQRANDEDDEWKKRKVAVEKLTLNLEARMDKAEKTLAMIREWKTRKNQIQNGLTS